MVRFPDRSEWKEEFQPDRKGGLIWHTDGSKTNRGTGASVYCDGTRRKLSFSLGQYTTVFQAEVYAIKACAVENLDRNYRNRNIYILSDSQAVFKALGKHQITSKLVWDCRQSLIQLAEHNRVQLIWVPGREGIDVNETADQLARTGSGHPFIGPEPACGISIGAAKKAVRD
jgi:ribonuclease HI